MKSKTKIILLVLFGVGALAIIVIAALYYTGYLDTEASGYGGGSRYPSCPKPCSFETAGNTNKFTVTVVNRKTGKTVPGVFVTFKTDDCDGKYGGSTPWPTEAQQRNGITPSCTTNDKGKCWAKVCVNNWALYKINGVRNTPARCHFVADELRTTISGGNQPRTLRGEVECFGPRPR